MRAFVTNALTSFTSCSVSGLVTWGSRMIPSTPLLSLVKIVTQVSGLVLGYGAGRQVQRKWQSDVEAVGAGLIAGYVAGYNPDQAAQIAVVSTIISGIIGTLFDM